MCHFIYTKTYHPAVHDDPQTSGMRDSFFRRLRLCAIEVLFTGAVVLSLLGSVCAEEPPIPTEPLSPQTTDIPDDTPDPAPAAVDPVTIDPFIQLRGSVWRTKAGIVFLKTPVGLLTLTSKTTLKDLKASQEVRFWVHEHHFVVEIRKRDDESLVHHYLSGPMTSGTDVPRTLRWWGPNGEQTVQVGTQEERLTGYREGDPLTVEVDETNTISGVHDLQFDLQVSQAPPAGADVQLLLTGTVSKIKSNFVFVHTPIGLVMLNSKIGVPRVKVGQPLTLHIDHEHVTVTSPPTETPTPPRSPSNIR
jgi:hypothetical protein